MRSFLPFLKILVSAFFIFGCSLIPSGKQEVFIGYKNSDIEYMGRIDTISNDAARLIWPGSSVKINFEGKSVWALMKDKKGENYYNVIIDDDSIVIFHPDTIKMFYLLASDLENGKHSVELFKRTEFNKGETLFYGFKIEGDSVRLLPKLPEKKRKIEFYGNSITAGYAVEDTTGKDNPDGTFTNNYLSYAAITARYFGADYRAICKGGIGITISWFPYTMPEIYDRLDPTDPSSKWDFSKYTPEVVVINLLQNDSWLVNKPERKEFKKRFGNKAPGDEYFVKAYQNFVKKIRDKYPKADIICMLGNMDITKKGSKWPGIVEKAVSELNDDKIHVLIVPFKGTVNHPNVQEQQVLADSLINAIDRYVKW